MENRPGNRIKGAILAIVALGGSLALSSYDLLAVRPKVAGLKMLEEQLEESRAIYASILTQPVPGEPDGEEIRKLLRRIPLAKQDGAYVSKLAEAESQSGVNIRSIQVGVAEPVEPGDSSPPDVMLSGLQAIPVELAIEGTYDQVTRFMDRLDNLERLTKVDSWQWSAMDGGEWEPAPTDETGAGTGTLKLHIRLTIYQAESYAEWLGGPTVVH